MLKAATYLLSYSLNCNNYRDNYRYNNNHRNNRTVTAIPLHIIKYFYLINLNTVKTGKFYILINNN